jgi:hypothetical protein
MLGHGLVCLEFNLPRQQTRQQQVSGAAEGLDLQMELVDEAKARRYDTREAFKYRPWWLWNQ